ncbi:MAG: type II toxin-antitoxin system HicB family antitoxin, partial [Planctomycetota bacterium]
MFTSSDIAESQGVSSFFKMSPKNDRRASLDSGLDADGGYTAEVPALPGCYSEGDTLEAATAN